MHSGPVTCDDDRIIHWKDWHNSKYPSPIRLQCPTFKCTKQHRTLANARLANPSIQTAFTPMPVKEKHPQACTYSIATRREILKASWIIYYQVSALEFYSKQISTYIDAHAYMYAFVNNSEHKYLKICCRWTVEVIGHQKLRVGFLSQERVCTLTFCRNAFNLHGSKVQKKSPSGIFYVHRS